MFFVTFFELLFIEAEATMKSCDNTRAATALNTEVALSIDLLRPTILANGTPEADIKAYIVIFGSED